MRYILQAGDYSDNPNIPKELPYDIFEAQSEELAKIYYCAKYELNYNEFAERDWDLLSGSYNYMWIDIMIVSPEDKRSNKEILDEVNEDAPVVG